MIVITASVQPLIEGGINDQFGNRITNKAFPSIIEIATAKSLNTNHTF